MPELINKDALIVIFKPIIKALFDKEKEEAEGATINIDEFRKKYCGGKGREWVRVFIFDEFPEVDFENDGFVVNPRGGKKTIIFRKDAKKWIEANYHRIDWNASIKELERQKMMKVTTAEIIRQLVSRGVFTEKKDAEYQVGIKNEQIVVNKNGSAEIAYLGNTLESVIQLADMFKKVGTKEQQKQINAALADLVTIGDY